MPHPEQAVRVGGAWLAVASFLMIVALGLHGPIAPALHHQMARIVSAGFQWSLAHWAAAAALSLYAVSGLIMLTSQSRLTDSGSALSAWAVVCVGCLWTTTTAVAEATVVADAAISGSEQTFEAWWRFAAGRANGFAFFALAVAAIAGREARRPVGARPAWAAWAGVVTGLGSFSGWALGMWLGVAAGSVIWVVSSILTCLWTLWFGTVLMRTPDAVPAGAARIAGQERAPVPPGASTAGQPSTAGGYGAGY
jgi:hypothetical protein